MKTGDAKIATVLYYLLLIPTVILWFFAVGNIITLLLIFTGVWTGSAAAGGSYAMMGAIVCSAFGLGLLGILKDFRRRMKARVSDNPSGSRFVKPNKE